MENAKQMMEKIRVSLPDNGARFVSILSGSVDVEDESLKRIVLEAGVVAKELDGMLGKLQQGKDLVVAMEAAITKRQGNLETLLALVLTLDSGPEDPSDEVGVLDGSIQDGS